MFYQPSQRAHGLCNRVYTVLNVMLTTFLSPCLNLHSPKYYSGRWVSSGLKSITGVSVPTDQGQNDLHCHMTAQVDLAGANSSFHLELWPHGRRWWKLYVTCEVLLLKCVWPWFCYCFCQFQRSSARRWRFSRPAVGNKKLLRHIQNTESAETRG